MIRMITATDSSKQFIAACEKAGIPATVRQWKKWQKKRGLAWANR